jgi:hypothetical protein
VEYGLPLKILSYEDLYGWTMDRIVAQVGKRNNCTPRLRSLTRYTVLPEAKTPSLPSS